MSAGHFQYQVAVKQPFRVGDRVQIDHPTEDVGIVERIVRHDETTERCTKVLHRSELFARWRIDVRVEETGKLLQNYPAEMWNFLESERLKDHHALVMMRHEMDKEERIWINKEREKERLATLTPEKRKEHDETVAPSKKELEERMERIHRAAREEHERNVYARNYRHDKGAVSHLFL